MKRNPLPLDESLAGCVAQMPEKAVRKLLDLLAGETMDVVRGPRSGLVMMTARDTFDADFFLGEVLVTEAEVNCGGFPGYGMVLGDDAERALARAAVAAVGAAPNRPLRERVIRFLKAEKRKMESRRKRESALISRTRVDFETMKRT